MADNTKQPQPKTIFEQLAFGLQTVNENIIDLSKDIAVLFQKVDEIHAALYPPQPISEPDVPGAEKEEK
ncbi:MAG: hypothetical protein HDR82_09640 [Bacteroides sp.]|nr:hypothetical protein [Bacteroides sp.]